VTLKAISTAVLLIGSLGRAGAQEAPATPDSLDARERQAIEQ